MIVYKASELGSCSKYLIAKRCDFEPDIDPAAPPIVAFERGKRMELEIIEWMKREGWEITDQQKEYLHPLYRNDTGESIVLEAHPDAIGQLWDAVKAVYEEYCIEIKTCSLSDFLDLKRNSLPYARGLFPRYRWQVSVYALVSGLPIALVVREHETVEQQTAIYYLTPADLHTPAEIEKRIRWVEGKAADYEIPLDCDLPNIYCPLYFLHETEIVEDEELEKLVEQFLVHKRETKAKTTKATTQLAAMRLKILHYLDLKEGEGRSIDLGRYKVSAHYGPTSYPVADYDELRKRGVDPQEIIKPGKKGYRLRVTDRFEKNYTVKKKRS